MVSQRSSQAGPAPVAARRRRLTAVIVLLVVVAGAIVVADRVGSSATPRAPAPPAAEVVVIYAGQRLLLQVNAPPDRPLDAVALRRALRARLARGTIATRGNARINYVYDVEATVRRALALGTAGGRIQAVREAVSSRIAAPVVRQFQRNACEAAALHILLASAGVRVSQRRPQAGFPRSGPLDPVATGAAHPGRSRPRLRRATDGGFGIHPGPVAATARRYGRRLDDLTASASARIYARLLAGRTLIAWIGLSDGPYGAWRSPQGRQIEVNFGEHTIVLAGINRNGDLRVVNPLQGTLEIGSRRRFEAAWQLLGHRALGARL